MEIYNEIDRKLNQTEALVQVYKDMVDQKKRETKMLFIALIVSILTNLLVVGCFLWYESGWNYTDTTTTKTEQVVDGEGGNLVNGDQYNDKSTNNSGGKR